MKKYCKAFTYKPKIEAVFNKECTQTIRPKWTVMPGDRITWFEWNGRPYFSTWGRRLDSVVVKVVTIDAFYQGIIIRSTKYIENGKITAIYDTLEPFQPWKNLDWLAKDDHIDPPKGRTMGQLFNSKYKLSLYRPGSQEGKMMQVITWKPVGEVYRK